MAKKPKLVAFLRAGKAVHDHAEAMPKPKRGLVPKAVHKAFHDLEEKGHGKKKLFYTQPPVTLTLHFV